ncbi:alpha/beta hydrolase [Lapillicoccus sp.]|uniref:alpha/beta hydrolase n=1 Tax=Lapillicoccus sp. TaxID=1909287 RepID=UPI0032649CA4
MTRTGSPGPGPLGGGSAGRAGRAGRGLLAAVVGVVASLSLSSCLVLPFLPSNDSGSKPSASRSTPVTPQTPPSGTTGLDAYYSQQLTWSSCTGGECAKLKVPVDYSKPSGNSIELALLRVVARDSGERIGSLVVNPGGPGGSGVDYARYANQIVGAEVRKRFDIVGFDPRGVGRSAPIDCLSDKDLDAFLGTDPTPDTPAEEQDSISEAKKLADGCAAKNPALIAHVSTVDAAKDMDILRAALGETKLNYLGKSYGTFLGATYADLFPTLVGRFVLDGVVAPDLTSKEISLGQAKGFELATRSYVADCIKSPDCPVGQSVDEGMTWIQDFLKGLDAQPLPVTDDQTVTQLNEAWGSIGIADAMYEQALWKQLNDALRDAKGGDGNALMRLADDYARRTPGGQYQSNIMEVIYAVNCSDKADTADIAQVEANANAAVKEAPTWGRFLAWGSVACGVWPVKPATPIHKVTAPGSGPIVVVGTTRDPATPYEWSVRLRNQLSNATLITFDGDGHTAYMRSNSCVNTPIDDYYVNGTVPQDGLKC